MTGALRVQADFNYGGRDFDTGTGVVMMSAKRGAKENLWEFYAQQFETLGATVREGLELVLWDDDSLDDGTPAFLGVDAVVGYDPERGWHATYDWEKVRWVPVERSIE